MSKRRKIGLATDYFFEDLYRKIRSVPFAHLASKFATLMVLAILNWVKHIY